MDVRAAALEDFDVEKLAEGRPLATLEDVLVPLYLRHRYQMEAAAKLVAGVQYEYQITGSPSEPARPVPADVQRRALRGLLSTLEPEALRIPEHVRGSLPPRPPGYPATRELFAGDMGLIFDPYAPAASIADFLFALLLHPERATRLAYQALEDSEQLDLEEAIQIVDQTVFGEDDDGPRPYDRALQRVVQDAWVKALLGLAQSARSGEVLSTVHRELSALSDRLAEGSSGETLKAGHLARLGAEIDRFLLRPYEENERRPPVDMPPGSPIGSEGR
jgi:hypothetical protein